MGLYDGASGRGELACTAHVAKLLQAPVVLVVDAAAMARSVAAIVHGYRTFDPAVNVAGVILNRVGSEAHATCCARRCRTSGARRAAARRGARGAGAPPRPRPGRRARAARRAGHRSPGGERRARTVTSRRCSPSRARAPALAGGSPTLVARRAMPAAGPRVAIARGPAFSFHYEENLELLRGAGAELVAVRPAHRRAARGATR